MLLQSLVSTRLLDDAVHIFCSCSLQKVYCIFPFAFFCPIKIENRKGFVVQ